MSDFIIDELLKIGNFSYLLKVEANEVNSKRVKEAITGHHHFTTSDGSPLPLSWTPIGDTGYYYTYTALLADMGILAHTRILYRNVLKELALTSNDVKFLPLAPTKYERANFDY